MAMLMATRKMNSVVRDDPGPVPAWDGVSVEKRLGGMLEDRRREACEKVEDGAVVIDGRVFRLIDWSAYGFSAGVFGDFGRSPGHIDCELTDHFDFKLSIHFRSPTKNRIEFVGSAIVIRIDKERQEMTADFAMLDEEGRIAIADHFADDSISGVGATASPPGPAPSAPQQPEARLAEERRRTRFSGAPACRSMRGPNHHRGQRELVLGRRPDCG